MYNYIGWQQRGSRKSIIVEINSNLLSVMKQPIIRKAVIVISIVIIVIFVILFKDAKVNTFAFLLGVISQLFVIIQQLLIEKK